MLYSDVAMTLGGISSVMCYTAQEGLCSQITSSSRQLRQPIKGSGHLGERILSNLLNLFPKLT